VLIRSSAQLRLVIRYVLRNPVALGLCTHPQDWRWSSYQATLSDGSNGLVVPEVTLAWFADDGNPREHGNQRERFSRFVNGDDTGPLDDAFVDDVELPCVPGLSGPRPALEEILARVPGASGIAHAHGRHGYALTEIATALGRSSSAVGRMLVAYEAEVMRTAATWPHAG
jgi:hypothetical protein